MLNQKWNVILIAMIISHTVHAATPDAPACAGGKMFGFAKLVEQTTRVVYGDELGCLKVMNYPDDLLADLDSDPVQVTMPYICLIRSLAPLCEKSARICMEKYKQSRALLDMSIATASFKLPKVKKIVDLLVQRLATLIDAYVDVQMDKAVNVYKKGNEGQKPADDVFAEMKRSFQCEINRLLGGHPKEASPASAVVVPHEAYCAGWVGSEHEQIRAVMQTGSLREKFYVLYIASEFFIPKVLSKFEDPEQLALIAEIHDKIKRKEGTNSFLRDDLAKQNLLQVTARNTDGSFSIFRDDADFFNAMSAGSYARLTRLSGLRTRRQEGERFAAARRMVAEHADYDKLVLLEPLHPREIVVQERCGRHLLPAHDTRPCLADGEALWHPGASWYTADTDPSYVVLKDGRRIPADSEMGPAEQRSLRWKQRYLRTVLGQHHPVLAGISGSVDLILTLGTYLGINSLEDLSSLRLALVAWMVPLRDHSLHEILVGSKSFLCIKDGPLDYKAGKDFYRHLDLDPTFIDKIAEEHFARTGFHLPDYYLSKECVLEHLSQ